MSEFKLRFWMKPEHWDVDNNKGLMTDGVYYSDNSIFLNLDNPFAEPVALDGEFTTNEVVIIFPVGLKDLNGVSLYAGDIVQGKAIEAEGGFDFLGEIIWVNQNDLIGWHVKDKHGGMWDVRQLRTRISVDNISGHKIGNIYENPELLNN